MTGFTVDIPALRQAGSHAIAEGTILSDKVGGTATLDSAAATMSSLRSGPLLTTTATAWEKHAERLAALVRSYGDRILQAAEQYDGSDNNAANGFKSMLADLGKDGDAFGNLPEVLDN